MVWAGRHRRSREVSLERTVEWYGPDGAELRDADHRAILHGLGGVAAADAEGRPTGRTTLGAIQAEAERLSFVSRRGMLPGTQVLLPAGVWFERAVHRINQRHSERLCCEEIHFPTVFDGSGATMRELTRRFDDMGRTYQLAEDPRVKLSYAADPNLFLWLAGQRIDVRGGPRFLFSPITAHKRFLSGEVSIVNLREYALPDVHAICAVDDIRTALSRVFTCAADGARALVRDDWLVNIDVTAELRRRWPGVAADVAAWSGGHVRVTTHRTLRGYMSLRAGVNASCGAGSIMMYNVQWDETNGERFDIRDHRGDFVGILHTTLLGGVAKALPILIGRGLSGLGPRRLPLALAPVQLHLIPVRPEHAGLTRRLERTLTAKGLRVRVADPDAGPVGRRIAAVRRQWGRYVSVVGDDERHKAANVRDLSGRGRVSLDAFVRAVRAVRAIETRDDRRAPTDGSRRAAQRW
jgi:hypothetical protein